MAQQRMAETESMVFGRAFALLAVARAAAAGSLMAIAACAPMQPPREPESTTPAIQGADFLTRDGLHLPLRHWDAEKPHAVLVALHGMSDYSEAFDLPGP